MTPTWLRRLLHLHSPSLVALGNDPVTSRRWVKRCAICAHAYAPPPTPEQVREMVVRAGVRAHDLLCDCDDERVITDVRLYELSVDMHPGVHPGTGIQSVKAVEDGRE